MRVELVTIRSLEFFSTSRLAIGYNLDEALADLDARTERAIRQIRAGTLVIQPDVVVTLKSGSSVLIRRIEKTPSGA